MKRDENFSIHFAFQEMSRCVSLVLRTKIQKKFKTGISVCSWAKDDFGEFRWKLLHWNDVAHLG